MLKTARCVKDLKDNKDDSLHLMRKYARIFVLGHYLFLEAHIFLCQMEAIVCISCITQVTFKFIDETLLVDNRGLKLMLLKLLLELRAYKHTLDSGVQLGA